MYHAGFSQIGIHPRDIPYIASARTGESSWILGLAKLGGSSSNVIKSQFKVIASLRTLKMYSIKVGGIKTFIGNKILSMRAYVYTPNEYMYIKVKGGLALPALDTYVATSTLLANKLENWRVTGTLALGTFKRFISTGIKGMSATAVYTVNSALRTTAKRYIGIIGTLQATTRFKFRVTAYTSKAGTAYMAVLAKLGLPLSTRYTITGTLKEKYKQMFCLRGTLANTVGHYFLTMKGNISVAIFISSLSRRINDMSGNTKWFK